MFQTYSQDKYDYNWITGYYSLNDSITNFGGNKLNFNNEGLDVKFFSLPVDTRLNTPCSISNSKGEFQFYSGGCRIYNAENQVLENGEGINEGEIFNQVCGNGGDGYNTHNGLLSLPLPNNDSIYFLFHIRLIDWDSNELLYSVINMKNNNGLGKVTEKNQLLYAGDNLASSISAVRHGNGRDWWIITENFTNASFQMFLLDPEGIHGPWTQTIPEGWVDGHVGVLDGVFSQDGTKFAQNSVGFPPAFTLYDFNRCNGELSNPKRLDIPFDTISYPVGINFSKDTRYAYITNQGRILLQYDLTSPDINTSVQLIDTYDGFISQYGLPVSFFSMAYAPDDRIYMTAANGVNFLHRINSPDSFGSACNFIQRDVRLPATMAFRLPNYPNYRLYEIPGSSCDTLDIQHPIVAQWRRYRDSTYAAYCMQLVDYSYYQPDNWQWTFGDGTSSTEQSPVHTFPGPGIYSVCLIVSNADGSDTLCRVIEIDSLTVSTTHVTPVLPEITISPNPCQEVLQVNISAIQYGTPSVFRVVDLLGHVVLEKNITENNNSVLVNHLPAGLYVWQLFWQNRVIRSGKLVKTP